jgi:hypothetical protein
VNYACLPDYVFIARRSQRIYPVYTIGDEVVATTPGGPQFRDVELAKVREHLTDYATIIGELGAPGKSDKLHVRGVSRRTLALRRPVFYLKKRVPGQADFWAPVFEVEDRPVIYAYVASARREVPVDAGLEVLTLRDKCAEALAHDKRLIHNCDLRVDRMMPGYWDRVRSTLTPETRCFKVGQSATHNGVEIPLYRNGQVALAAEYRASEDRWGLFVGNDLEDVRERLARDYVRRGLVDSVESVRLTSTQSQTSTSDGKEQPVSVLDRLLDRAI